MCETNDFYLISEFLRFGLTEKALFRVILGLLGISIRSFPISVCRLRESGRISKSVYVRAFHDLELLRYVLRCAIERQL